MSRLHVILLCSRKSSVQFGLCLLAASIVYLLATISTHHDALGDITSHDVCTSQFTQISIFLNL